LKFKIDENPPVECAALLRDAGFQADTVADEGICGGEESELMARCQNEHRVLATLDLDFSDIRVYAPHTHLGILVLRSRSQDKQSLLALMQRAVWLFTQRSPVGELWIVEARRVRFRSQ
jgi:predicted nuclease of predicted toxin-antitoxin system